MRSIVGIVVGGLLLGLVLVLLIDRLRRLRDALRTPAGMPA